MLGVLLKRVIGNISGPSAAVPDPPRGDLEPDDSASSLEHHVFHMDWGYHTILRLVSSYDFQTVLDIGSGAGEHARFLRHFGKQVFAVDRVAGADYVGDFNTLVLDRQFDVVWCSHVLEHQRNVGAFLEKIFAALKDDGILALTVPCHPRERLIAGHLTVWNAGLLCYNLVLAGFDCSEAKLLQTFELGLIVRKRKAGRAELGHYDPGLAGDELDRLGRFFPFPVSQGCNAEVYEANWGDRNYSFPSASVPGTIAVKSKNVR
ncbi:MAG: class I SAM-dependent methyltransferase [Betaproteobacteria bacterium]|nr:MAG: class I SAM-dependent methyltransferase [Betaproteobacteria bacterium]